MSEHGMRVGERIVTVVRKKILKSVMHNRPNGRVHWLMEHVAANVRSPLTHVGSSMRGYLRWISPAIQKINGDHDHDLWKSNDENE